MAEPDAPTSKDTKKNKGGKGKKKEKPDSDKRGAEASFCDDLAQSIGCKGITTDIVQNVLASIRKAIIRDVQKHGHFKLANIGVFRLKHVHGKPARKQKIYDRNTKGFVEKAFAATPPCKRLTGRAMAPLKRIFRESCEEGAAAPVPSEQ